MSSPETIVPLGDGYYIRYASGNWMLTQRVVRQKMKPGTRIPDGEVYEGEETLGYYMDLGALARRLLHDYTERFGPLNSIEALAATVFHAEERVTAAITKATGWPVTEYDSKKGRVILR
jgi:hypothetical protein